MHEKFLHEGETLLASRRSSPAVLILCFLRSLLEGGIAGVLLSVILSLIGAFAFSTPLLPVWAYASLIVFSIVIAFLQHIRTWNEARFRVTTERILIADPTAFFHAPLFTVKWLQYQESEVDHRQALDVFFLARPIKIRYGTADAKYEAKFPSLRYAEDLKHFLDKVDAAVRRNDVASLKPFVAKPRGKRDGEMAR
ncbi:MAG: hypothetical protein HOO67_03175 [Candidatus Peribacteraceae bacterium]|nr:hypothetical protein [Candidatus Peribacteraceae bacterium]